jgi:hypothetical protein
MAFRGLSRQRVAWFVDRREVLAVFSGFSP